MSEQKTQDLTLKKQEEKTGLEDAALEQDKQIGISTTQAYMHNENAIKPVITGDNSTTHTTTLPPPTPPTFMP